MKKILFSFIAVFSIFVAINSCQAVAFTTRGGNVIDAGDDYQSYFYWIDYLNGADYPMVLLAKSKGEFKLVWNSNTSTYMFKFYPEGSETTSTYYADYVGDNDTKYDFANLRNGNQPFYNYSKSYAYTGNVPVTYESVNPGGNEQIGDSFYSVIPPDTSISNPDSRLQLTYEYNEELTECKINATLANGSFTDKIYYSNYQPRYFRRTFI